MVSRRSHRNPLSGSQLEVMQVVWERGQITVSEVWQTISQRRTVARNTVLTVLDRLEKKGWLSKRMVGNSLLYSAAVSQKKSLTESVKKFVDTFFGGSADSLMMALLENRGVSPEEAQRIRERIDKASRQQD